MQKISVITINRNNSDGLKKTIESVINQTYSNVEYIVIDGASTDSSVDIIKEHSDSISYWVSEPDKGIYNAMNKGIEKSTGEYLIFMNSGDCFYSKDVLTDVFSSKQEADILAGSIVSKIKNMMLKSTVPDKITFYYFFVSNLWHQATFIKRDLFFELGFYDEDKKIVSDWKFVLLALVKHERSYQKLNNNIAITDPVGISNTGDCEQIIKKEREETLLKYFAPYYDDYKDLYKRKRFTLKRLKNNLIWRFTNL